MPEAARVVTTDAEIDLAIRRARQYEKYDRRVVKVTFSRSADRLRLILEDGVVCTIPRRLIQGLAGAQKGMLKPIQILGGGTGLLWPALDVAHSVPALLTGVYGSSRWMKDLELKSTPIRSSQEKQAPSSLDERRRGEEGRVSEKSGNTLVGTLRKIYGEDFLSDWRSDAKLSSVRQETEMSLNEMVRQYRIGKKLSPFQLKAHRFDTKIQEFAEVSNG